MIVTLARGRWGIALLALACGAPAEAPDASMPMDAWMDASTDAAFLDAGPADAGPPPPPLRVLFVGNSYTYVNDLPGVVEAIVDATTPGGVEVESVTMGGARLADHWDSTGARERVLSGDFDVVVLQGQSIEPVTNPPYFQEYAERFAGALSEAGAGGVWFATWARRDVEAPPEVLWPAIEEQYAIAAARNGDRVARVGAAWEIALLAMPEVALLAADQSHPTPEGTLLASCVIAQAITSVDPRLPLDTPLGITRDVAEALCAIAEGGVVCNPEESLCEGACVPWGTSDCGGCGVVCAEGDPCRRGVCGCDSGLVGCDERCVPLGTVEHCASCGDRCGRGRTCVDAACECPSSAALDLFGRFDELTAIVPECSHRDLAGTPPCLEAAHRYCAETGCFASGFLPAGHAPRPEAVMCVPGEVRETSFATLGAHEPTCDGVAARAGQPCATAAHRYCVAAGFVSGFGPVLSAGDVASVTCLATGALVRVSELELSAHISRCTPDAGTCSSAAWNLCQAHGHTAGFGPVEAAGDERDVVCID